MVIGGDPVRWNHGAAEYRFESGGEANRRESLVEGVERSRQQTRLLPGGYHHRLAVGHLLQPLGSPIRRGPYEFLENGTACGVEAAIHIHQLSAIGIGIGRRSGKERCERGVGFLVVVNELRAGKPLDPYFEIHVLHLIGPPCDTVRAGRWCLLGKAVRRVPGVRGRAAW